MILTKTRDFSIAMILLLALGVLLVLMANSPTQPTLHLQAEGDYVEESYGVGGTDDSMHLAEIELTVTHHDNGGCSSSGTLKLDDNPIDFPNFQACGEQNVRIKIREALKKHGLKAAYANQLSFRLIEMIFD